jgi:hypothetical protein
MRHPYRTVSLVVVTLVLLTGCSVSYPFQLLLTVKNADDGTPVEGVTVVLDTTNADEDRLQFDRGSYPSPSSDRQTDAEGRLTFTFQINNEPHRYAYWFLKLRKDGFEPAVVDIRPNPVPKNHRETTPLPVVVEMKPLPKKP